MIEVLRVDDRLLHGQVAVSWTRYFKVDVILVANDHLITDKDMQVAFKLATPAGIVLSMKSLQGAVNVINNPKHAARKIMVITKDCIAHRPGKDGICDADSGSSLKGSSDVEFIIPFQIRICNDVTDLPAVFLPVIPCKAF